MARIRSFAPGDQSVSFHPSEVDCFWQTLSGPSGDTLVHLSTFGSDSRQSKPKSSQSFQFDRQQAEQLLGVLATAFPGLVANSGMDQADPDERVPEQVPPRLHDDTHLPCNELLVSALENSKTFQEHFALVGRVSLKPADVARLIGTLAAAPASRVPLDRVSSVVGILPARLQGALATLQKVMNVEGYLVVHVVDAHLTLDVPLLREQFQLD